MTRITDDSDKLRCRELTREAAEDVDTGRVVAHLLVEAWAQSLGSESPAPLPMPTRPA